MAGTASVFIDEVEVTQYAVEGSCTRALNRPAIAQVKLPMTHAIGGPGSLLKVYFQTDLDSSPELFHHGRVLLCETDTAEDTGYTVYNSTDPLELWKWRPVRDASGNLSLPGTVDNIHSDLCNLGVAPSCAGPKMIEAIFKNSENPLLIPGGAEGPLFLKKGTFESGGVSLAGAPKDWPINMAQFATILASTGEVDIVITPIELEDSGYTCGGDTVYNHGRIDVYNGNYGQDLSSVVAFQYGLGQLNIARLRWNEDMTNMSNKLEYLLGPKCDDEHWQANITGTAGTQFPITAVDTGGGIFTVTGDATDNAPGDTIVVTDSTGNDGDYTVVTSTFAAGSTDIEVLEPVFDSTANGFVQSNFWTSCGIDPTEQAIWINWHNAVVACAGQDCGSLSPPNSRGMYGVRMDLRVFDGSGDDPICVEGAVTDFCLWKKQWLEESWLRQNPQTLIHITPTRDTAIGEFDIGDLVTVEASAEVRGGFSGVQRVYAYTVSWDQDSVLALGELQVSADSEGFA